MMKRLLTILMLCVFMLAGIQSALALNIPSETEIRDAEGNTITVGTFTAPTYTLIQDVPEGLVIETDDITLDGNGHIVTGSGSGNGISVSGKNNVEIKNLVIQRLGVVSAGFYYSGSGINLSGVTNVKITGVTVRDVTPGGTHVGDGIHIYQASGLEIMGVVVSGFQYGIWLSNSSGNTVNGSELSGNVDRSGNNGGGIALKGGSSGNVINENTIEENYNGIVFLGGSNNQVYNNNFIENKRQVYVSSGSVNIFSLDIPIGGNHWTNWIGPDGNDDGIVDDPYIFTGGQDDHPWAESDGWLEPVDATPPVITLNGEATLILECGIDTYTELGATVFDEGDTLVSIVIGGDTVDTMICGTNTVTYDATDASGNAAIQVIRTVTVEDTIVPVIQLDLLTDTLGSTNKKLVKVADISASDLGGEAAILVEVTSNESITQCDWVWKANAGELYLRATRDERGNGRVYTIIVTALDESGNIATDEAVVTVSNDPCNDDPRNGKKDKGVNKGGKKKDKDKGHDNKKNKDKDNRGGNQGGKRR